MRNNKALLGLHAREEFGWNVRTERERGIQGVSKIVGKRSELLDIDTVYTVGYILYINK